MKQPIVGNVTSNFERHVEVKSGATLTFQYENVVWHFGLPETAPSSTDEGSHTSFLDSFEDRCWWFQLPFLA